MLVKTSGIVFRAVKYSETSIITDVYTRDLGMQTYIVNGVRSAPIGNKIEIAKGVWHDLTIECKEIGAVRDIPIKNLPCRVESIDKISQDVAVLSLKLPANERLQFLAGQYIDIVMKDGKRRSFYGWPSILKRVLDNRSDFFMLRNYLPINLMHRQDVSRRNGYPLGDETWSGRMAESA